MVKGLTGVGKQWVPVHREGKHKQEEQQAEGEAGSLLNGEPNVGLDPRTPGS